MKEYSRGNKKPSITKETAEKKLKFLVVGKLFNNFIILLYSQVIS